MTFDANETGVETGQPIELYEFVIGSTRTRMTSSENDVTIPSTSETFTATAIKRGELVEKINDPATNRLSVELPADNAFVTQFRNISPGNRAILSIFRMHRGDLGGSDEKITIFKGTIRNVSYINNGRETVLHILPITSAYSRAIPRKMYQGLCNHMLYDARCTISKDDASFKFIGNVSAVSGSILTVDGAAAFDPLTDFFQSGYVEFNNDFRTITFQSNNNLTLITPFLNSPLGSNVIARAGCKHRVTTDCTNKFNNLVNFGGFPFVPKANPFRTGIDNK